MIMKLKQVTDNINELSRDIINKVTDESKELDSRSMFLHYDKLISKVISHKHDSK